MVPGCAASVTPWPLYAAWGHCSKHLGAGSLRLMIGLGLVLLHSKEAGGQVGKGQPVMEGSWVIPGLGWLVLFGKPEVGKA